MLKQIEKALEVFDRMRLREAVTIYEHLKLHGLTMDDLAQYILLDLAEEKRWHEANEARHRKTVEKAKKAREEWYKVAPPCPDCGAPLAPPKALCGKNQPSNKKGWSCQWYCSTILSDEGDCVYQKYTYENAAEEINKLMERKKNG